VLIALGPQSPLMGLLHPFGVRTLAFTFTGLVIGSVIYSLPFAVQPLRNAFEAIGPRPLEVAATLRAPPLDAFFTVALPMARRGFVTAAVLVFAHTVGEFGVVLMIGGGIPGKTEVVSIRIYELVEALQFGEAHRLAAALVVFAFLVLFALLMLERRAGARAR
jgi:molybdate transport system permease protein